MSQNIPAFYVQQYASNVQMLLQQKESRLSAAVTHGHYTGKSAQVVDQVGKVAMQPVSSRFAPMGRVDAAMDSRWVFPSDFDLPQMIDSFDKLRLLTDPSSVYVTNAVAAANRKKDELILDAMFATAKTGENGGTSTVFDTSMYVTAGSGLTVAKLIEAKKLLMKADVDLDNDPIYCAITADEHEDLMGDAKISSADYADKKVLVDGKLVAFYGINFIHTELVGAASRLSGGDHQIPMWAKSGMHFGTWNDITTSIDKRTDIQGLPWQSYVYMTGGATRLEEKKVVRILTDF